MIEWRQQPVDDERASEAADQLVDQWLAHFWALHEVAPDLCGALDGDAPSVLRQRASGLLHDLTAGLITRTDVLRLIHPVGLPSLSDGWWSTPLGRLLQPLATSRQSGRQPNAGGGAP